MFQVMSLVRRLLNVFDHAIAGIVLPRSMESDCVDMFHPLAYVRQRSHFKCSHVLPVATLYSRLSIGVLTLICCSTRTCDQPKPYIHDVGISKLDPKRRPIPDDPNAG